MYLPMDGHRWLNTAALNGPHFWYTPRSVAEQAVPGEVSERLKEHAWKVCIRQRIEGSNPSLSAKLPVKTKRYTIIKTLDTVFVCKALFYKNQQVA